MELLLAESTLEKGPGVDSQGGVALDVEQVASVFFVERMEEVVEADVAEVAAKRTTRCSSSAESTRLACTTIAIAFQRMKERIRSSRAELPGLVFWRASEIVLM